MFFTYYDAPKIDRKPTYFSRKRFNLKLLVPLRAVLTLPSSHRHDIVPPILNGISETMQSLRQKRALALLPAILWIAVQFAMTGVFSTPASAAYAALSSGQAKQIVEICSPDGLRTIALDAQGRPVPASAGANTCDWCQSFGAFTLPAPTVDGIPHGLSSGQIRQIIPNQQHHRLAAYQSRHLTRAPPSVT